jgi:hypothetical protein
MCARTIHSKSPPLAVIVAGIFTRAIHTSPRVCHGRLINAAGFAFRDAGWCWYFLEVEATIF